MGRCNGGNTGQGGGSSRWKKVGYPILAGLLLLVGGCRESSAPKKSERPADAVAQGSEASSSEGEGQGESAIAGALDPALPPYPEKPTPTVFTDVTRSAGIRFRHHNGAFGRKYMPETTGSGAAFLDYDNDGWQDILLINATDFAGAPRPRRSSLALYHNERDGTFKNVTVAAGLTRPLFGMGVAVGDYDNDGRDDIFVTALGESRLYRNLGTGRFSDVTAQVGMGGRAAFSTSAAWLDYDRDGKLDLFVGNYVDWSIEKDLFCTLDGVNKSYCTPESYGGQRAWLYRNVGGRFVEVGEAAGIADPTSKSLGVSTPDYDLDGWVDLFVANDTQPNKLYRNNGNGTFTEVATTAGVAFSEEGRARAGMGVDFADYDGTGYPGLAIGNFSNEMLGLYHNEGKSGLFIDEAPTSSIGQATLLTLTFGLFFFDYDLDGRPDLFLANGHVADDIQKVQPKIQYAQAPQLFRNEGRKRFREVTAQVGAPFQRPVVGRGAAYGDYDNDGDLDILLTTNGGPAYLFRNEGGNQNRWLRIRTIGVNSNTNGIGAKVTVTRADGVKSWQMVHSGSSYCSQSELPLTFGLGRNDRANRVEVRWPSGKVESIRDLRANQLYTIREGSGIVPAQSAQGEER